MICVAVCIVAGDKSPGKYVTRGDEKACFLTWFILIQVENTAFSILFMVLPSGWRKAFVCFIYFLFVFR